MPDPALDPDGDRSPAVPGRGAPDAVCAHDEAVALGSLEQGA